MNKKNAGPTIVTPDLETRILDRMKRNHDAFDEAYLQNLLAKNEPEFLPVSEIRRDVGSLLFIGQEVRVNCGKIDNLYLSTGGYPVIVETKLWRNPQARREVLSQTLDYIKDVTEKKFSWFEQEWKQRNPNVSMLDKLTDIAGDDLDNDYTDRVNRALSRGDIIAIIVGDGIEQRLRELVTHFFGFSSEYKGHHLRYSLALVELACYPLGKQESDGLLIVPRIIQDVEPVQRAYVRVDFAEGVESQVKITSQVLVEEAHKTPRTTSRPTLDEEDFLRAVEKSAGQPCRDKLKDFYADLITTFELEPDFKSTTLMIKIPHPDDEGSSTSVLGIDTEGRIYNAIHFMRVRLWGIPDAIVNKIASDYWGALNKIDARFRRDGIQHKAYTQFVPFMEVADKIEQIKACVGAVVDAVRTAYDKK